ncbi:MAG: NADH-quinone oxidoreductase subunit G [Neisseriaceae bacterium]|nr:MAG: NADH-quinone oxidoreductase subunit G [Neisseriaceae bacterium]
MIQIEIDGKEISVEKGTSVIEAAAQAGTFIPHFCYHKKLSIAANCRMCLVEIEKNPKPVPACATLTADGMKIHTDSQLTRSAQKGVMEFLLLNHPLDCPICDQGGECQLQDLAVGYGHSHSRFIEEKRVVPLKDMGPLVAAIEMSRCIHCTRCTRFTEEIAGYQEIGMINRGEHSEIVPFIGKVINSEISGNVIDLCPVGALTSKPFRYNARTWELSRRKSISAHDSLGSNLEVQVKDKTVRRVLPRENEEINECWLSDKDRFAYEGLNHDERVYHPMIKQDNRWFTVDWMTALRYVEKGLLGVTEEYGKDSIGVWVNNNNTFEELYLLKKLAKNFGIEHIDSHLRVQDRTINKMKQGALWLGQSINSFLTSDVIFIIGSYLRQDQPLLTARIRQAVNRGARLIVLQAFKEELHIPKVIQKILSPNEWLDFLSKIQLGEELECANILKSGTKVSIVLGEEAQLHHDFALLYQMAQNLASSVSGKIGIFPNAANAVGADMLGLIAGESNSIVHMIDNPKKAVILANVEPDLDSYHNKKALSALSQADTVIALTPYASESIKEYADVILPIATFTETPGSFVNMEGTLQSFYSTVPVLGYTKPMWKVIRVIGNLLGLDGFDFQTSQEVLAEAVSHSDIQPLNSKIVISDLSKTQICKTNGFIRVGGISLYNTDAIVRRSDCLQQTVQAQMPCLAINSKMLQKLGLREQDRVLANQTGGDCLELPIRLDDSLPDYVVHLPAHQSNQYLGALMDEIVLKRG